MMWLLMQHEEEESKFTQRSGEGRQIEAVYTRAYATHVADPSTALVYKCQSAQIDSDPI